MVESLPSRVQVSHIVHLHTAESLAPYQSQAELLLPDKSPVPAVYLDVVGAVDDWVVEL